MREATMPGALALFRAVGVDGTRLLFWKRSDDGWLITRDGTPIATGPSGEASTSWALAQFLSLAREHDRLLEAPVVREVLLGKRLSLDFG